MDTEHQLLLDVFDVHSGDAAANAARVMANTGDDPGIDAGVSVSQGHLLLHVRVAEKNRGSASRLAGQSVGTIGQPAVSRCL
jgi:hypothetical protein